MKKQTKVSAWRVGHLGQSGKGPAMLTSTATPDLNSLAPWDSQPFPQRHPQGWPCQTYQVMDRNCKMQKSTARPFFPHCQAKRGESPSACLCRCATQDPHTRPPQSHTRPLGTFTLKSCVLSHTLWDRCGLTWSESVL